MRRAAITLAEAQSFDRVAGAYDRLGDLNPNELIDSWLEGLLPAAAGRALDIGCGTGGMRRSSLGGSSRSTRLTYQGR